MFKFLRGALTAVVLVVVLRGTGVLRIDEVVGQSMYPTLHDGDYVVTTNLVSPKINDIIVVKNKERGHEIIKRLLAVEGDSVTFEQNGDIFVNGVKDEHNACEVLCSWEKEGETKVSKNEYFVAGDNRCNSLDSREFGAFSTDYFVGTVVKIVRLPKIFGN